jgi:hypothetical protein
VATDLRFLDDKTNPFKTANSELYEDYCAKVQQILNFHINDDSRMSIIKEAHINFTVNVKNIENNYKILLIKTIFSKFKHRINMFLYYNGFLLVLQHL